MIKGNVEAYRLRYIVPFAFDTQGMEFNEYCKKITEDENWFFEEEDLVETDVYDYVRASFTQKENRSNAGCSFVYRRNGNGNSFNDAHISTNDSESNYAGNTSSEFDDSNVILEIAYAPATDGDYKKLEVNKAGMYLFRTGIGLFWYEVKIHSKGVSVDYLVKLQYSFKELNRKDNENLFFEIVEEGISVSLENDKLLKYEDVQDINKGMDSKNTQYIRLSSRGEEYYVDRNLIFPYKSSYDVALRYKLAVNTDGAFLKFSACKQFLMGSWIESVLSKVVSKIKFYPDRIDIRTGKKVPDKAVLFTYLLSEIPDEEENLLSQIAYYLSNGYKESYMISEEAERNMYKPFANACWNATKEGCGYFVKVEKSNQSFFSGNMIAKFMKDYFLLYILLLHQSYTLLHFTGDIEEQLSASVEDYSEESEKYVDRLEKIKTDINVFLVKSVYASVSHVQHQNAFYEYVEKQLRVKEDISSITIGLEALTELQKARLMLKEEQKRELMESRKQIEDDNLSIGLGLVSLFAIFSAFVDGFELIDRFFKSEESALLNTTQVVLYIVVTILVLLISGYTIYRMGQSVARNIRNKRSLKQKEKEYEK